jgi:hypothetical protein
LAAWYFKEPLLEKNIHEALRTTEKKYRNHIVSAGAITQHGEIQWGSTGFGISTPPNDGNTATEIISVLKN